MKSHLSFENFAAALATWSATSLVACAGAQPQPVTATEVTHPAAGASTPSAALVAASGPDGRAASQGTSVAASAPAVTSPGATLPALAATPPAPPSAGTSAATATSSAAASPKPALPKKGSSAPKASAAEASCGAGTCGSDPAKKIL